MKDLERENQLLKKMVHDLATLIRDLIAVMPSDLQEYKNSKYAMEISQKLIDAYGPTLSTPDNRH